MKDIILTHEEIKYRENNPVSDRFTGYFGSCSKYKDGLIKVFYRPLEDQHLINLENNLKRDSKIIMYPRCMVIEKETNNIRGYFMNRAPGITLLEFKNEINSGKKDLSFEEFLTIYYDRFLPELKKEEVLIFDMKDNQIYIDDNFYLTDTDPFLSIYDKSVKGWLSSVKCDSPFEYNTKQINEILKSFINFIGEKYIWVNEPLKSENYMYKYVDDIISNYKVKTLSEYRNWK